MAVNCAAAWKRIAQINDCRIEPDREKAIACFIKVGLTEAEAIAAADNMSDPWNPRSPLHKDYWGW